MTPRAPIELITALGLAPGQGIQASAQSRKLRVNGLYLLRGNVTPSRGDLKRCLRLVELSQRSAETQPGIACLNPERLGDIERNAVKRATKLRTEIAISTFDDNDQWPSQTNNRQNMFEQLLSECCVHTHPPGAASVTPTRRHAPPRTGGGAEGAPSGYEHNTPI